MYINTNVMANNLKGTAQYNRTNKKNPMSKASDKNAAVQIMNQKKLIKNQIASVKLAKDKQIANLEKRKNELIGTIKDVCEKNKASLSGLMGISEKLDNILSGNVDRVMDTMDASTVGQVISGAQMSVAVGDPTLLKKYYESGAKVPFKQFIEENATAEQISRLGNLIDENGNINYNRVKDKEDKGLIDLLEVIKKEYEQLFKLRDAIDTCKKDAESQIQKLNESLTKINENMAENCDDAKILNGKHKGKKKINVLV